MGNYEMSDTESDVAVMECPGPHLIQFYYVFNIKTYPYPSQKHLLIIQTYCSSTRLK